MSYSDIQNSNSLQYATGETRATFIRKTYLHLAFALLAFVGIEAWILTLPMTEQFTNWVFSTRFGWLGILGGFMVTGWIARGLASGSSSKGLQYAGLALYVIAEAIIFAPLLMLAVAFSGPELLVDAAIITGLLFAGLTATVFITRKDFSFLRSILVMGGFIAIGIIIAGTLMGFTLGLWFSAAMIIFACGAILYDTSNILHHYPTDRYVGAALELFASVALLLWYVIRLLMSRD